MEELMEKVDSHFFKCSTCFESIEGFMSTLDHMEQRHQPPDEFPHLDSPKYPCLVCLKTFGRREHVKRHLIRHMRDEYAEEINKTNNILDFEDDLQRCERADVTLDAPEFAKELKSLRPKRLRENRNILNKIEETSWDVGFTCFQCSEEVESVLDAYEHMRQIHPAKAQGKCSIITKE